MKLIDEIIEILSSDSPDLNTALFKTKVLLHRLGEKELVPWVDAELNGYPTPESVPKYRVLSVTVLGNISNIRFYYSEQVLPVSHLDERTRKNLETRHLTESIAALESFAKDDSTLAITIPPEIYHSLSEGIDTGFNLVRAWGQHSPGSMLQVINQVRSRLLDFVLQLSEKFPDEMETDKIKEKSKEIGTSEIFKNAIFGDNVTITIGDSNVQNITNTIIKNDFESLANELRKHSVQEEDIESLKIAIDADADALEHRDKRWGPSVRKWANNMLAKVTEAVWVIELSVAGNLLTEALKAYYGW